MRLDQTGSPQPGFYETHSSQGIAWRSTPKVRNFPEGLLRPKVLHFLAQLTSNQSPGRPPTEPYVRFYKLEREWLEVSQNPWDTIPTLQLVEHIPTQKA